MDVVLGVAVSGSVARLALVGSGAAHEVIDQSVVDLADHPIETLTQTVVGTNRLLADESHRLVATRLCWTDHPKADQLRRALEDSGVHDVVVLSESQAVTALMRAAGRPGAVLVMDDQTATLSIVGSGVDLAEVDEHAPPTLLASGSLAGAEATATLDTLMARLGDRPDALGDLYLVGASPELTQVAHQLRDATTMRVEIADDPTFALARGAALTAAPVATGLDATAMAPAALTGDETTIVPAAGFAEPSADDHQLAYSMAGENELLPVDMDDYDDFDDYEELVDGEAETGPVRLSRRSLIVGNAVIAFAVVGFASLAVAVVVAVRPTAANQPVVGLQNAAPGKFMPLLPTQQQAPVPAPPPGQPNAGFQGGVIPDSHGYIPEQLIPEGGGLAPIDPGPAPVAPPGPGSPGFVPGIPYVPGVPYPGWQPPYQGWQPPYPGYNPYPGWRPPYPGWRPPYPGWQPGYPTTPPTQPPTTPPTTPPTQPPTTPPTTPPTEPPTTPPTTPPTEPPTTPPTKPPTTTQEPPTTTQEPPTTTQEPLTTTHAPPTTQTTEPPTPSSQAPTSAQPTVPSTQSSVAPKPTTQAPVPTTQAPAPTTQAPVPTTQAPVPTHVQTQPPAAPKPVTPQAPHGGGAGGGGHQ